MKKNGLTLIEMLAAIVLLGVIAVIVFPVVRGLITRVRLNALKDTAYGLVDSGRLYTAQYGNEKNVRFDIDDNSVTSGDTEQLLSYKGEVKEGTVIINTQGKTTVCVTDGKNSAYKNYNETEVTLVESKRCNIPSNTYVVFLDDDRTMKELSNEELTNLTETQQQMINQLQSQVIELATASDTNTIMNKTYPIGSIYISTTEDTVEKVKAKLKVGTWVKIEDRFLLAAGSSYAGGSTGGSASTTLGVGNLPVHNHAIPALSGTAASAGGHTHSFTGAATNTDTKGASRALLVRSVYDGSTWVYPPVRSLTNTSMTDRGTSDVSYGGMQAKYPGGYAKTLSIDWSDSHAHSVTAKGTIGSAGDHTHSVTTETSNTTGCTNCSGNSFTNMPPYVTVYVYKRTA